MDKCWLNQYQQGVPTEIDPNQYNDLSQLFAETFNKYSNTVAFSNIGTNISYAKIDELSINFAAYLQSLGLKKGAKVAVMMPNLIQYPIAIFAIIRAGFIVVNVNPLYTATELAEQLHDCSSDAIIVVANFAKTLEKALPKIPSLKHIIVAEIGECFPLLKQALVKSVVRIKFRIFPKFANFQYTTFNNALKIGATHKFNKPKQTHDDIAFIQYTGGTTGVAKGAVLTHKNIIANILQTTNWLIPMASNKQQIIVTALPMYHIFSLTANLFTFFKIGAKNILITNPRDTKNFIKEIKNSKFTAITGVNTLYNSLICHPNFNKINFKHVKIALSGGMALQKQVASQWLKSTKKPILEAYGLTETSPAVAINPLSTTNYNGSVGLPLPSTDISIRDTDGNELSIGEVGELSIKGPQVMREYWQKPKETEETFWSDGYLRTGDTARIDERGYVYLVDRIKDLIIVSGFNVYPHQIEEVILQIPGVLEAAVISVNKGCGNETVKACVVTDDTSVTADSIIEYCRENLTAYKIPKIVEFYSELPKSNIGKILKRELS